MKKMTGSTKKLLAGALALSMAVPTTAYAAKSFVLEDSAKTEVQTFLRGDVDGNGAIELVDAQKTLKYALKIEHPDAGILGANKLKAADVDENGSIELADAQKILKAALKLEKLD